MYVVGAANSAGQAALNLARYAKRVVMVVRAGNLEDSMSQYLVERIRSDAQHRGAPAQRGRRRPAATTTSRRSPWPTAPPAPRRRCATSWLFVFIGAMPRTDWLGADVARTDRGFVVTGQDLLASTQAARWTAGPRRRTRWRRACPASSPPATCGSDSMKRVASAVGEGAMSVYLVHRYLATT